MLVYTAGFAQECELSEGGNSVFSFVHLTSIIKAEKSSGLVNTW